MNKEKLIPELRFPEFQNEGEWDLKEFSNFIKLDRGSSPRPIQEYLTQDVSGVNWIKIGDTKNAVNSVIYQVEEKITSKGAEKSRRVEIGELILANSMSFGKTYELAIEGCIYDGWFVLRKYDKYFVKLFLLQLLNSDFMQNQYKRLSAGGIVQNISSDIVYNSKLFHTSLFEQQKIASCLSSLDEVIATHSQKLDLLKDHKKALMQNLFPQDGENVPKYRFKEFEKDGEWQEKKLGDMSEIGRGKSKHRPRDESSLFGGIYPFIQTGDIRKANLYLTNYTQTYSEKGLKQSKLWDENTLCITIAANIAETAILKIKACFPDSVIGIIPKKGITDVLFINYLIENFKQQIQSFSQGMAQDNLNQEKLSNLIFLFPLIQEQQKIASCLSSLDALISAQAEKIEQLKLHKKGLMQGLFPKIEI